MATKRGYGWVRDPHSGGVKISPTLREETERRLRRHGEEHYAGKYAKLDIRFRGVFCYIDAYQEPDENAKPYPGSKETLEEYRERLRSSPLHLCRLRYCGQDEWSLAFYKYSDMKYEPSFFPNGTFYGTPEEGFDVGAVYLQD